jgi:hypothetical protein
MPTRSSSRSDTGIQRLAHSLPPRRAPPAPLVRGQVGLSKPLLVNFSVEMPPEAGSSALLALIQRCTIVLYFVASPICEPLAGKEPGNTGEGSRSGREALVDTRVAGPLLQGHVAHRGNNAFYLLDMRAFMACQPLRIKQHGPLEWSSRSQHGRRT